MKDEVLEGGIFEEGTRSIVRGRQESNPAAGASAAPAAPAKSSIDKKKLIVYSAIMKPKFDDFSAD